MAFRLTSAADYAIRSMIYLASLPEGLRALDVAEAQKISPSFLAKVLRTLVRAGLLNSVRGLHGGFSVARDASEISLLQVVEAMEGPFALTDCIPNPENCELSHDCPASWVWLRVQYEMTRILAGVSLEDLISAPRRDGRVAFNIDT